jgi:SH3-like domain-containing protein
MKRSVILSASFCALLFIGGCAQTQPTTMPESVDPYFRPKRVYAVNFNQAWELTLKGLRESGTAIAKADRENGLIRTAYQNPTPFVRNQCEIKFLQEPVEKTYIHVSCRYETKGREDQYRDLTYNYPREVMNLEEEIYRKIEPFILPAERVYVAETAVPPKEGATPAPAERQPPTARVVLPPAPGEPQKPRIVEVPIPPTPEKPLPSKEETRSVFPPPRPPVEATPPAPPPAATATKGEIKKIETPARFDMVTVAATNLRSGPSLTDPILAVLPKGEEVQRIDQKGSWIQIKTPGAKSGWVFNEFLSPRAMAKPVMRKEGSAERPSPKMPPPVTKPSSVQWKEAPAPSPAVLKESAKAQPESPSKIFFTTKRKAPMMTAPSAKSKLIYVLRQGRKVEKIGETTGWMKVKLSWGDTGWVSSNLLEKVQ